MKVKHMKQPSGYEKSHKGQTLVSLLMFVLIAMTVITSAITTVISNTKAASVEQQSIDAYYVAEAGAENALMRLLRDQSYTGETLPVGNNSAVVIVSGNTIVSTGSVNNLSRKIQVDVSYTDYQMTVINWQEIP